MAKMGTVNVKVHVEKTDEADELLVRAYAEDHVFQACHDRSV